MGARSTHFDTEARAQRTLCNACDRRVRPHGLGRQRLDESVNHFAQTAGQRFERALGGRRGGSPPKGTYQAAVFLFGVGKARKQRAERQPIDIARVNAGQQRLREIHRGFTAEAACHERADRFVAPVAPRRHEQLGAHPEFCAPRKQSRANEWSDPGRNAEHRRGRQRIQLPASLDEGEPGRQRRHQSIAEPKFPAERDAVGFLNQQGIGPRVDDETVDCFVEDDAARPRGALEDEDGHAAPVQFVGRRQAGDTGAHDDDIRHKRGRASGFWLQAFSGLKPEA